MHFEMSSAICFNLNQCKILLSGNGLKNLWKKPFENTMGKGVNNGNKLFSRFSAIFSFQYFGLSLF